MTDLENRPADARTSPNPYLAGNMAPVTDEVTAFDLEVTGEIPVELEGRWLRNGPNPVGGVDVASHHWFLGAGMVHGAVSYTRLTLPTIQL